VTGVQTCALPIFPKGRFQKVNIVTPISGQILFEIPSDKMGEFEANFRKCVQSAISSKGVSGCIPVAALRIQTDKGKYFAYIDCDDYGVTIYRSSLFHRGFSSSELRKVFYDAGLKYTSGGPKPPKEKEVNEPNYQEILQQSVLKAAENARKMKEAHERGKETNQPLQKLPE